MAITKTIEGSEATITIEGWLDTQTAPELAAALAELEASGRSAMNVFTFGPVLIQDGKILREEYPPEMHYPTLATQRIAICQTGKLEYLCVVTSGPDHANSKGMTIPEFVELLESIGGIQTAYNLDGGQTGEVLAYPFYDDPYNHVDRGAERIVSDIIYFATAIPEGAAE
jgi:exopolysaccharide biosynthesis protein